MSRAILLVLIMISISTVGCLGEIIEPGEDVENCKQPAEFGIALSFDDNMNIVSWNESIDFFAEHEMVATFYVDKWDKLSEEEIAILHRLQENGHEIGIHTMNHSSYFTFLEERGSAENYLESEVLPAKQIAENLGFEISTFSYPFGHRDAEIDSLLLNHFTVLRGTIYNSDDVRLWRTTCEDGGVFRSISVTGGGGSNVELITDVIEDTKPNLTILVYGHGIESGGDPVKFDVLESFVIAANDSGKEWLLMRELAEK